MLDEETSFFPLVCSAYLKLYNKNTHYKYILQRIPLAVTGPAHSGSTLTKIKSATRCCLEEELCSSFHWLRLSKALEKSMCDVFNSWEK